MKRVKKAVIPAAGLGTRFLPAAKAQPKEMLPLVDTPIIQLVVEEAVRAGIEDVLIITGKNKRAIEDHFDKAGELEQFLARTNRTDSLNYVQSIVDSCDVHFVRQKEPMGLGHAVWLARKRVGDEPCAVLLGDEIFVSDEPALGELLKLWGELGGSLVAVNRVRREEVSRYGVVSGRRLSERVVKVEDMVEKPHPSEAPSDLAIVGRYVLEPEVFDILGDLPPGRGGEIQLTDALRVLAGERDVYSVIPRAKRYDVDEKLGFLVATVEMALARDDLGPAFATYLREVVATRL